MILSESLVRFLQEAGMSDWAELLPQQVTARMDVNRYGDLPKWQAVLDGLPEVVPTVSDLNSDVVTIGCDQDLSAEQQLALRSLLMGLHPWRKGPFELFGIHIDTEWHSDWKWNRIREHITPLQGRNVLDVGSGNGYYALRMHGAGAARVIGIDPTPVFVMQYQVFRKYLPTIPVDILPLALEDLPGGLQSFDTVFSMGVLYHRRSPLDHLYALKDCLRPGGELVLETLVIEGDEQQVLMPEGRYAKMRNTWFIPSVAMLEIWLRRCGYRDVRLVDINRTSTEEQRSTEWMTFESLADFLDQEHTDKTVEGYPGPVRATLIATKPA